MASPASTGIIVNRGRGPEIAGTRITVFDVMDYLKAGWHRDRIAGLFRLSSRDVQAAIDYIEQHPDEVEAGYQRILERQGNYKYPPDVRAKIERCGGLARQRLDELHRRESGGEFHARQHS